MKILGAGGYSSDELKSYRPVVASNCITQMQALVEAMEMLDVKFANPANTVR
jgi:hypothetical protein